MSGVLDGGGAEADVSAVLSFGRRGGQKQLFGRHAAHQRFVPVAAGAVPDKAGDLGLMHRKDHRRGSAGAAERVAHVGNIEDRRAVAAELPRDLDAQKPLLRAPHRSRLSESARRDRHPRPRPPRRLRQSRCAARKELRSRKNCSLVSSAAELRSLASCTFMTDDLQGLSVRNTCASIALNVASIALQHPIVRPRLRI